MVHENYFEINADSYFDLGMQEGKLFGKCLPNEIKEMHEQYRIDKKHLNLATQYLEFADNAFSSLVEELKGCAQGSGVGFDELWLLTIIDEIFGYTDSKCTSIITNSGFLISHNEDWEADSQDQICILKKSIRNLSIFELFYINTLGGNSVSLNSHGFIQTINTLTHSDSQIGIPKDIVARWLSETDDPERAFSEMKKMKRASGYNHNIADINGRIWNIECSAKDQKMSSPKPPFAHTNHYLTNLCFLEANDNRDGTIDRFDSAVNQTRQDVTVDQAKALMSDTSGGRIRSIFNETTIARMIIDLKEMSAHIWLKRESEKGWITYDLNHVLFE